MVIVLLLLLIILPACIAGPHNEDIPWSEETMSQDLQDGDSLGLELQGDVVAWEGVGSVSLGFD